MIEKFKKSLDQGGEYVALLTDLSEAFDCLPNALIIAKLHAYGFCKASLRFMHSQRRHTGYGWCGFHRRRFF